MSLWAKALKGGSQRLLGVETSAAAAAAAADWDSKEPRVLVERLEG